MRFKSANRRFDRTYQQTNWISMQVVRTEEGITFFLSRFRNRRRSSLETRSSTRFQTIGGEREGKPLGEVGLGGVGAFETTR